MSPDAIRVLAALLFAQILLGGYSVVGKFGVKAIHPILFALLREVSATPILLLLAYFWEFRPAQRSKDVSNTLRSIPQWSDMPAFCLLGLTGVFGNQLFFVLGLARSASLTAAIIQPVAPIWTLIFALILKMEIITMSKIFGIVVSVLGSLVTLGFFNLTTSTHIGVSSVFFFLNTACMGAYFLFQKPLLLRYPPITTTAVAYLIGAIMMSLAAIIFGIAGDLTPITSESFSHAFWPLVYTIFGPSICTYLLVAYANTKIESTLVSASKTLQPLSASFLAYVLLGERLLPHHAIGAVFLAVGMIILFSENKIIGNTATVKERTP